ncbi:DegT/DnrJ/EryC1/StrS family aminotransferase [Laribacter hongkongensis]|uniref:DegT/DnrJ/EryC1/StrS family aminotransferase n=1 Tax=Laribacter hongkongensis TaxID=168471 RepID=UPI001EFD62D5|nr:DegT/DnrJ/EryC1/StrS family aminotransferase [Laribacter hongkongensis]MCG9040726.1 DegT/DnrJ/EryC1/StrS family aminotransferase [Laribacter hongkongensis]MCG9056238.1 DegT/DnrJ/EryC1/StrS family aminotransferase [Laribacter hongkongensis]MCG9067882.1 DegT/DnrJ/EryC1/StrS family aminotransferase [Laribacter hongkongensis]
MIPVNTILLDGNEKKYLEECIDTGWISSEGPFVRRFETEFARRVNRKHAVAVANGSLALDAAMLALDLELGTEVIMPSFTIISCASAIVRAGCVPVAVDSDPLTWNMDPAQIESRITTRTRAIMVVHIYGLPCDMVPILEIAKRYNLKVIEDAAEAHGQFHKDQPCGSFGDLSIFSFYPNKHVTTGEGGIIVMDSDELADKCQRLRNLCFIPERRFVHEHLGWNMRMTNLQAALGVAQLERLDEFVERKRRMGKLYTELLADVPGVQLPESATDYAVNIYWVYGMVLDEALGFDAVEAMKRLGHKGIGTRPFFWPMHEQPVFQNMGLFEGSSCPVSERLARRGFYIPSGLALTDEQIHEVAAAVREVLR